MVEPHLSVRQKKSWTQDQRARLACFRHLLDLAKAYPEMITAELKAILRAAHMKASERVECERLLTGTETAA